MLADKIDNFLNTSALKGDVVKIRVPSTEFDINRIQSAVIACNLTSRTSNFCSSELKWKQTSLINNLKEGDKKTWVRMALFIHLVAITVITSSFSTDRSAGSGIMAWALIYSSWKLLKASCDWIVKLSIKPCNELG